MNNAVLTGKQEKYVQGLVSGLSQREAYRQAYPKSKLWKDLCVDVVASNLLKKEKVLARYKSITNKLEKKSIITAEKMLKVLADNINDPDAPMCEKQKSIDLVNKMTGAYINKVEVSGAVPIVLKNGDQVEE